MTTEESTSLPTNESTEALTPTPTYDIFVAFKGGATLGPLPSAAGGKGMMNEFARFLSNNVQSTFYFGMTNSDISIDFREVAAITLVNR